MNSTHKKNGRPVKHIRTDPQTMDVFIRDESNIGLEYFKDALQLNRKDYQGNITHEGIHMINNEQWSGSGEGEDQRIINKNKKDINSTFQGGIRLFAGDITLQDPLPPEHRNTLPPGYCYGLSCPTLPTLTPKKTIYCKVDTHAIRSYLLSHPDFGIPPENGVNQAIAHELGHAVGMGDAYEGEDEYGHHNCSCRAIMGSLVTHNGPRKPSGSSTYGGFNTYQGGCDYYLVPGDPQTGRWCTDYGPRVDSRKELILKCPRE